MVSVDSRRLWSGGKGLNFTDHVVTVTGVAYAAEKGELDGEFPDLTLLEFDLDEDRDRLTTARACSARFVWPSRGSRITCSSATYSSRVSDSPTVG